MGRERGVDWRIALIGVALVLVGGYAGRTAPGLWYAAIRHANAPECRKPGQTACVDEITVRLTKISAADRRRGREHRVSFSGDQAYVLTRADRTVELVARGPTLDRLALGPGAMVTARVWEGRATEVGRDGVGYVATWNAPRHAAVNATLTSLALVLGGLALLALATRRSRAAIALAVATRAASPPGWLDDSIGRLTAPEALAVFAVAATGMAFLLSVSRTAARTSLPTPRAARPAARSTGPWRGRYRAAVGRRTG